VEEGEPGGGAHLRAVGQVGLRALTEAETLLWEAVRNRQVGDLKIRRQHPIGPYIVDFYCAEHQLVIEVEGPIHQYQQRRDAEREASLRDRWNRVIRFTNDQVINDLEWVLDQIRQGAPRHHTESQDEK
jgi:very-short-patch-repair endonuclease